MKITERVLDDEFFEALAGKNLDIQLIIEIFRNKINLNNLKLIRLASKDIVLSAAKNSEPIQAIEFFQVFKPNSFSVEAKLEIFENCKFINGHESVRKFINYIKLILQNNPQKVELIVKFILNNSSFMSSFEKSNRSGLKNRNAIIGILKIHLNHQTAMKLLRVNSEDNILDGYGVKNEIGRILLNFYFKASSNSEKMISESIEISVEILTSLLNNFISETLSAEGNNRRNRASKIIKCFRFYEETESIIRYKNGNLNYIFDPNYVLLISLIDAMVSNLKLYPINQFISSPQSIASVYNLIIRRLDPILFAKMKDAKFILRRMIFTFNVRFDIVESILNEQTKQQLKGIPMDWEFINEIKDKTKHLLRIQELIKNFETIHKY